MTLDDEIKKFDNLKYKNKNFILQFENSDELRKACICFLEANYHFMQNTKESLCQVPGIDSLRLLYQEGFSFGFEVYPCGSTELYQYRREE